MRWDPGRSWNLCGKRGEGGVGGQGPNLDRKRGRDKDCAMARGRGGAGQASAGARRADPRLRSHPRGVTSGVLAGPGPGSSLLGPGRGPG